MRSGHAPSLALAVAAAVLGGCATLAAEEGSKTRRVCINRSEINAISALDDHHALARLRASRLYVLTVDKACHGFKLARRIALSEGPRVCGDGLTLLSFEYPALGPMRCRIDRIDSVPTEDAAWELIKSRAAPE